MTSLSCRGVLYGPRNGMDNRKLHYDINVNSAQLVSVNFPENKLFFVGIIGENAAEVLPTLGFKIRCHQLAFSMLETSAEVDQERSSDSCSELQLGSDECKE